MKTVVIIIAIVFASSGYASDQPVTWTSDTTYVKGGVEYWDPIQSYYRDIEKQMASDPELEIDYNYFWNYEAPTLKRPDLDDQKEDSIV